MYFFIVNKEKKNQKKRNIKLEKIDKRKRKILVSKHIITSIFKNTADINSLECKCYHTIISSSQKDMLNMLAVIDYLFKI